MASLPPQTSDNRVFAPLRRTDLSGVAARLVNQAANLFEGMANGFSPGRPVIPVSPEPEPRQRQIQVGSNLQFVPRGGEDTSFYQLRYFSLNYDIARLCINKRCEQVAGLDYEIVVRDAGSTPEEKTAALKANAAAIKEVKTFFESPDKQNEWPSWVRMVIEDRLAIDAATLYPRKNRKGGLYSVEVIDGATIKPLVDYRGRLPDPPAPALQQVLWGRPTGIWDTTKLLYVPQNRRTFSIYGRSEIEDILLVVNTALRKRMKDLLHFTDSNIPASLVGLPDTWTAQQIREYQNFFDAWLAGDLERRSGIIFVPGGGAAGLPVKEFAPFTGDPVFDLWLLKITCAAFHVTPSELGFTDDVNRATSDSQENVTYRDAIKPLTRYLKAILDRIIRVFLGYGQLEFQWVFGESEDELRQAQVNEIYQRMGAVQLDDVRKERGLEPYGVEPFIVVGQQIIFIRDLKNPPKPGEGGPLLPGAPNGEGAQPNDEDEGDDDGTPEEGSASDEGGANTGDVAADDGGTTVGTDASDGGGDMGKSVGFAPWTVRVLRRRIVEKAVAAAEVPAIDIDIHGTSTEAMHAPDAGPEVPGFFHAVRSFLLSGMKVYLSCGRLNSPEKGPALRLNMTRWLEANGFKDDLDQGRIVLVAKPHTIAVVDDKSMPFRGDWPALEQQVLDRLAEVQRLDAMGLDADAAVSSNPRARAQTSTRKMGDDGDEATAKSAAGRSLVKGDYGCLMLALPSDLAQAVRQFARVFIPASALAADGYEDAPHVTVKYGIIGDDLTAVEAAMRNVPPVPVRLGQTACFQTPACDVVYVAIESPALVALNQYVCRSLPTLDTQPQFIPHLTLAYVQPGRGASFARNGVLAGREVVLPTAIFSPPGNAPDVTLVLSGDGLREPDLEVRKSAQLARDDLRKWRRVALRAVKSDAAIPTFHTTVIPPALSVEVGQALLELSKVGAPERPGIVRQVFEKALGVMDEAERRADGRTRA